LASPFAARCADCDFYVPIDVFKGVCHINKKMVLTDDEPCEACEPVRKCKFCSNFSSTEENLGLCKGSAIAYPEMIARTCEMFHPKPVAFQAGLRSDSLAMTKPSSFSPAEAANS